MHGFHVFAAAIVASLVISSQVAGQGQTAPTPPLDVIVLPFS